MANQDLAVYLPRRSKSTSPIPTLDTISDSSENAPLLGSDAQTLIDCNQKLKDLGIDETITLPRICVIGDQSTGKSSLIEAISTIQVPKAKGCCTQCPIAINLSSGIGEAAPWSCSVYIEEYYEYVQSIPNRVTKAHPFGRWQPRQEVNIVKLDTTFEKKNVSHLIRVAQAAVLNPNINPALYLSGAQSSEDAMQVTKFSPNVIRLDVAEAHWPNLSFIDLPGVIANMRKPEDRYLVPLMENLVTEYARDQRSLNLLSLPMVHDVENSRACAIIQELKLEDRTLAVFTKSDLADKDQLKEVLSQFKGAKEGLGFKHGYHIVMMPDRDDIDQLEARRLESKFFEGQPWSTLSPQHKDRLGVQSLSNYLRRLLFEKTAETLPDNLKAIEARLSIVNGQLKDLPAPAEQAHLPFELHQDIAKFEHRMQTLFSSTETRQAWNHAAVNFRSRLVKSRPTMMIRTQAEARILREAEEILSGGAAAVMSVDEDQESSPIKQEGTRSQASTTQEVNFDPVHRFKLEDIRTINQKHYSSYFFGEIELKAVDEMNKLSVQNWNVLLDRYMSVCAQLLKDQVLAVVKEVFGRHQHLGIYDHIVGWCDRYLGNIIHEEITVGVETCKREQTRPFTLDCDTLKEKEEICVAERMKKRNEFRAKLVKTKLDAQEGVVRVKREEAKEANLKPDEYAKEVQMSAKTRAYYEIASVRFTDIICQSIFYNLLPKCELPLVGELREYLGVHKPQRHAEIIKLMTENSEREFLRQRLLHEKHQLVEGHGYIQTVLGSGALPPRSPSKRRQSATLEPDAESSSASKRLRTGR